MARSPRYDTDEALGMVLGEGLEAFDSGSESEIEDDEEFPLPSESDEHTDSDSEDPLPRNEESQNNSGLEGSSDEGMQSLIINSKGSRNNNNLYIIFLFTDEPHGSTRGGRGRGGRGRGGRGRGGEAEGERLREERQKRGGGRGGGRGQARRGERPGGPCE